MSATVVTVAIATTIIGTTRERSAARPVVSAPCSAGDVVVLIDNSGSMTAQAGNNADAMVAVLATRLARTPVRLGVARFSGGGLLDGGPTLDIQHDLTNDGSAARIAGVTREAGSGGDDLPAALELLNRALSGTGDDPAIRGVTTRPARRVEVPLTVVVIGNSARAAGNSRLVETGDHPFTTVDEFKRTGNRIIMIHDAPDGPAMAAAASVASVGGSYEGRVEANSRDPGGIGARPRQYLAAPGIRMTPNQYDSLVNELCGRPRPSFRLESTASSAVATPGSTVTFAVRATNPTAAPLPELLIADELEGLLDDADLDRSSIVVQPTDGRLEIGADTLRWTGGLDPGESFELRYSVRVRTERWGNNQLRRRVSTTTEGNLSPNEIRTEVPVSRLRATIEAAALRATAESPGVRRERPGAAAVGTPAARPPVEPVPDGTILRVRLRVTNPGETARSGVTTEVDLTKALDDAAPLGSIPPGVGIRGNLLTWRTDVAAKGAAETLVDFQVRPTGNGNRTIVFAAVGPDGNRATTPGIRSAASADPL